MTLPLHFNPIKTIIVKRCFGGDIMFYLQKFQVVSYQEEKKNYNKIQSYAPHIKYLNFPI